MWEKLAAIIGANNPLSKNVADILAEYGTPSTSIAILENGRTDSKCYSTVGDDTETVFQCCSISKPVAALAVMKLISQNQLSLDEPITTHLPQSVMTAISTPETANLLKQVTIKHLLSHTAGLTVHGFPGYAPSPATPAEILTGKAPSNTLRVRLSGLPGQRFAYSGGGITVLQLILEHLTHKPFVEIIQELVLTPLNMTRSFYYKPNKADNHALTFYTGYQATEVPFREHPEQAAAGLWTTPTDLLKVVRAIQESLLADSSSSTSFLPRDIACKMLDEVNDGMALAWFVSRKNPTAFQHGGSNFGFRCHVLGYADLDPIRNAGNVDVPERSGICVMTNSEEGYGIVRKLMHAIAFAKGWPELAETYGVTEVEIPFRAGSGVSGNGWEDWLGTWDEDWEIVNLEGLPGLRFQGLSAVKLWPAARPGGSFVDLVLEGLEMMIRLRKVDGEQVVEVWHGAKSDITTLRRS